MKRLFHLSSFGLLVFKLFLFLTIIFLGLYIFRITAQGFYYSLSILFIISSILLFFHKKKILSEQKIAIIQILLETTVENVLIQFSGGLESPFIFLLVLDLFFAAYIISRRKLFIISCYVAFFYSLFSTLAFLNVLPSFLNIPDKIIPSYEVYFYYVIYMRVFLFLMIGYLASKLSERIVSQKQRIKQMETFTDSILYQIQAGLLSVDRDDKIIYSNKAAADLFHLDNESMLNMRWQDLVLQDFETLDEEFYKQAYSDDGCEYKVHIADDVEKFMRIYLSKFSDEHIEGKTIILRDLTIYKEMEKLQTEKKKMKTIGELSAALAHEIKNPLASICGSLEVLKEDEVFREYKSAKLVNVIFKETERLERILSEFLTFSGEFHLKKNEYYLDELINDVLVMIRNHPLIEPAITIDFEYDKTKDYSAYLDGDHLKQLIFNFVLNGAQSIEGTGQVSVSLEKRESNYFINVIDTGSGIAEADKEKVFQPFFSTKTKGIGLGLNVCKKIADHHGWSISFTKGFEKGTIFSIIIPIYV